LRLTAFNRDDAEEENFERIWGCDGSKAQVERTLLQVLEFAVGCTSSTKSNPSTTEQKKRSGDEIGEHQQGQKCRKLAPSEGSSEGFHSDNSSVEKAGTPVTASSCDDIDSHAIAQHHRRVDEEGTAVLEVVDIDAEELGVEQGATESSNGTTSWPCGACTFLNTKVLAPVCEVCGTAREEE
jgi:hypothetical protein